MKKIIHILIIIFGLFSLNIQAINISSQYNMTECEHDHENQKHEKMHNMSEEHDCCDDNSICDNCTDCKLCTNYVKISLQNIFSEYNINNSNYYIYFYNIKESNPKNLIIPPIV
tara:strand:+ start:58361 stop:58702 length:342 start_codon:yes stop_codon:yes gene_type:complete